MSSSIVDRIGLVGRKTWDTTRFPKLTYISLILLLVMMMYVSLSPRDNNQKIYEVPSVTGCIKDIIGTVSPNHVDMDAAYPVVPATPNP
jgi:hypothetical protein